MSGSVVYLIVFWFMLASRRLSGTCEAFRSVLLPWSRTAQRKALFSQAPKKYIHVPFDAKEEAKSLGAKWDAESKKWYIPDGVDPTLFNSPTFSKNFKFIHVPFDAKEEAKALGAKWDSESKKWYVPDGVDPTLFDSPTFAKKFINVPTLVDSPTFAKKFIDVPFDAKEEVKSLGARWDMESKKWYVPDGVDPSLFDKFQNVYLDVPFADKDTVKALGARWDKSKGKWFISSVYVKDFSLFKKWISKETSSSHTSKDVISSNSRKEQNLVSDPADAKKKIVLVSIDTNGLPTQDGGNYLPYDNLSAYDSSRMIQISFQLCNIADMSKILGNSYTIRSDGFPIDNSEYHNISLEVSKATGVPFTEAADRVFKEINNAQYLMAHNGDFVFNVLQSELFRHGMLDQLDSFDSRTKFCSMDLTEKVLKLKDKRGSPKRPSLKELVQATTGEVLPHVRNSNANVEFLRKAMQILVNTNQLNLIK